MTSLIYHITEHRGRECIIVGIYNLRNMFHGGMCISLPTLKRTLIRWICVYLSLLLNHMTDVIEWYWLQRSCFICETCSLIIQRCHLLEFETQIDLHKWIFQYIAKFPIIIRHIINKYPSLTVPSAYRPRPFSSRNEINKNK
jgi:hypothetical protein